MYQAGGRVDVAQIQFIDGGQVIGAVVIVTLGELQTMAL